MRIERFSFTALEKQLEKIGTELEKIELISNEIVRCRNAIQDVKCEVKKIEPTEIKITAKTTNQETSLIELVNCDSKIKRMVTKKIVKICAKNLCEGYNDYLERAENLLLHYKTKLEARAVWIDCSKSENSSTNENGTLERIIWRCGEEKLLELFDSLHQNEMIPKYSKEEILSHFGDEKQQPFGLGFGDSKKFRWNDSDNRFSVFVNELAERGAIEDEARYKIFACHFVNKKGKPFIDLPQKRNYTENYTKTGNLIRQILDLLDL